MRDIFGDYVEETDEVYLSRLEREAELADKSYAEMIAHCSGCRFFLHDGCNRDIDEFPDCVKISDD